MKLPSYPSFLAALTGGLIFGFTLAAMGQDSASGPVSTGTIMEVSPEQGTVTLRSDQNQKSLFYYRMGQTQILTAAGTPMTLDDVRPGMLATVHYTILGNRWYVGRLSVAEGPVTPLPANLQVPPMLTVPENRALRSKAATDRDITTQPGTKAGIDNDITTQRGSKAETDNDITTQPGSTRR